MTENPLPNAGKGSPVEAGHCPTCTCQIPRCPGCGNAQTRSNHGCDFCMFWVDR